MPLSSFQAQILKTLSKNRSEDSHLAGGAALHFAPDSSRYSEDLDYFHDSNTRVAKAFQADQKTLKENGYSLSIEINQAAYIRCIVKKESQSTKIEWAQDSSWRFMPVSLHKEYGYMLHSIDLVINKVLALAGREEARDYLDVINNHESLLPLGAQIWAACGKDPGLNPSSLLELLKRKGRYRQEDFDRLHLTKPVDVKDLKTKWLDAIASAEDFIKKAPAKDMGCLYYSKNKETFVEPDFDGSEDITPHFGKKGGVLPLIK